MPGTEHPRADRTADRSGERSCRRSATRRANSSAGAPRAHRDMARPQDQCVRLQALDIVRATYRWLGARRCAAHARLNRASAPARDPRWLNEVDRQDLVDRSPRDPGKQRRIGLGELDICHRSGAVSRNGERREVDPVTSRTSGAIRIACSPAALPRSNTTSIDVGFTMRSTACQRSSCLRRLSRNQCCRCSCSR
jgi:hypothetical protein